MVIVVLVLTLSLLRDGLKVKLDGEVDQGAKETVRLAKQM